MAFIIGKNFSLILILYLLTLFNYWHNNRLDYQ